MCPQKPAFTLVAHALTQHEDRKPDRGCRVEGGEKGGDIETTTVGRRSVQSQALRARSQPVTARLARIFAVARNMPGHVRCTEQEQ